MSVIIIHPTITAEVEGQVTGLPVQSGTVTLDALAIPYATANLTIPWADLDLDDLDPRDDVRVIINASGTGHWETTTPTYTYGHGPYGHGPYGGN